MSDNGAGVFAANTRFGPSAAEEAGESPAVEASEDAALVARTAVVHPASAVNNNEQEGAETDE